jgi:hypothetical protein
MFLEVNAGRIKDNITCIHFSFSNFVMPIIFISACPQNLHFFFHLNHQNIYSVPTPNVSFKNINSAMIVKIHNVETLNTGLSLMYMDVPYLCICGKIFTKFTGNIFFIPPKC